MDNRLLGV